MRAWNKEWMKEEKKKDESLGLMLHRRRTFSTQSAFQLCWITHLCQRNLEVMRKKGMSESMRI